MRINDGEGNPLSSVYLALTDAEARELIDALADLTTAPKGWHAHVSDSDWQTEITVARVDDGSAEIAKPS